MSNWSSTQLTDLGRALDAKVTAGTTLLSFTKMKLGSGTETAEDIPAMTDLVSPKLVLGISSCAVSASDDTICELISVASSSDVEDSFVVRELGVFATDPDVGEILYAVMLDSTPDTMPNENVSSPVTVTYQVNIVSANASSITAVIDPAGLVTASVLQAHNDSISAHKMAHWYRQNSKVYEVGDIAFSASLPSSLVLQCTTAGTTASTAPDFSGAVEGGTVTDGTVVWRYKNLLSGGGVPLGTILPYSANAQTPPYGFFFAEGQAVSRTMYADYFALVGTTYGEGDGSTTYNLPNMIGKYPQGDTTAGTYKSAGLPNIEGKVGRKTSGSGTNSSFFGTDAAEGALNYIAATYSALAGASGTSTSAQYITFDASESNPIYGASDTVTPPTLTCRWIVKVYDAPTPSSAQIDLSQYASDLANRLTREQTPAFNRRDVITTSGTYTAPVTGWYRITAKGGGGGGSGGYTAFAGAGGGEGGTTIGFKHMTAGDTAAIVIGAGGTGGNGGQGSAASGGNGGDSTVTVNNNAYTGGGGGGGYSPTGGNGGAGGTGTITGAAGAPGRPVSGGMGGGGGGNGGASSTNSQAVGASGITGGGGQGGYGPQSGTGYTKGGNGGDGFVWFEYFDPSL